MNEHPPTTTSNPSKRSLFLFGGLALLVVVAWACAAAIRSDYTGEKDIMAGWQDGLPAGKQVAEAEEKPMIVLFTATWCAPCQTLKKNVLLDDAVMAQLSEDYVPVQVDLTDQTRDNPNRPAAMEYGVRGVPTVLALEPDGTLITQFPVTGRDTPADFALWLQTLKPMRNAQVTTTGSR